MMKRGFFVFIFILLAFIGILGTRPAAYGQVNPPIEALEEGESLGNIWGDLRWGIEQIFHPVVEVLSPIPVQLGLGVNPRPEPVFDIGGGESEGNWGGVLGTERQRESTVLFFREFGDGAKVYSLTGNFYSSNEGKASLIKPSDQMTDTKSRSEVWGARLARLEEEILNCFQDSGVILSLLGLFFSALLAGIVVIVVKTVARKS